MHDLTHIVNWKQVRQTETVFFNITNIFWNGWQTVDFVWLYEAKNFVRYKNNDQYLKNYDNPVPERRDIK